MFSVLLGIQVIVSIAIISLVMLQQGKGADMGAAFGSGASGTVFGARGSGSFLTRATAILATVFFINCILIASPLVRETTRPEATLADQIEQQAQQQADEAAVAEQAGQIEESVLPADAPDVPATVEAAPADDLPEIPAETAAPAADVPPPVDADMPPQ